MPIVIDTLTQRIHDKSDRELRKKIDNSMDWIWEETGHTGHRPKDVELANLNAELSGNISYSQMPWIESVMNQFKAVAFYYLRDKYRAKALSDFMAKVESIDEIVSQLP